MTTYVKWTYSEYLGATVRSTVAYRQGTVTKISGGSMLVTWENGATTRYYQQDLRGELLALVAYDPNFQNL